MHHFYHFTLSLFSVESYISYPYITEAEELQIFEKTNGNLAKYAKELTRIIFKDTLHLYFKDQHAETRQWVKGIIDFRFPTKNALDYKQKWKNAGAAINSNMQLAGASAEQSQGKAARSSTPSAAASSTPQPVTTRLTRSSRISL
ncbi:hypothetical protein WR25_00911 [Diploscapter pachys]|uniref:Uncharacterized protein n=1 Tax=Diploscapter pachys TaxID=2018661 RepID=A0A2A2KVU4_9BILA|nr:hypothetical protein WR25_00911 [Diploscapter pachys]